MKKFSNFIAEAKKQYAADDLTAQQIGEYVNAVKKNLPVNISKLLYLTGKYNLTSADQLDEIRNASKGQLKSLVNKLNVPIEDLEEMWQMFKEAKQQFRLMPQYMTTKERESLMKGNLRFDDLTIDLETTAGRNAVARMYTPLVIKIANQWVGKSSLDKSDLMSAGMEGLVAAMADWKPEGSNGKDPVPFKTYAAYRIKQKIQNEIDQNSHAVSGTNAYAYKNGKVGGSFSIDGLGDSEQGTVDKLAFLGQEADDKDYGAEEKQWKKLYSMLEKQFSHRDVDIFYRCMGLNGRKREKAGDVAKSYGISQAVINNSIFKKIIKYLQTNRNAIDILDELKDLYLESLLCQCVGMDRSYIYETLINDDIYLMFESTTPWSNAAKFKTMYAQAQSQIGDRKDIDIILKVVSGDFVTADEYIKKHKTLYINFLKRMYPTEPIDNATDVTLLELMSLVQDAYKKFIKK